MPWSLESDHLLMMHVMILGHFPHSMRRAIEPMTRVMDSMTRVTQSMTRVMEFGKRLCASDAYHDLMVIKTP